jgi:hypothetical protein
MGQEIDKMVLLNLTEVLRASLFFFDRKVEEEKENLLRVCFYELYSSLYTLSKAIVVTLKQFLYQEKDLKAKFLQQ